MLQREPTDQLHVALAGMNSKFWYVLRYPKITCKGPGTFDTKSVFLAGRVLQTKRFCKTGK